MGSTANDVMPIKGVQITGIFNDLRHKKCLKMAGKLDFQNPAMSLLETALIMLIK